MSTQAVICILGMMKISLKTNQLLPQTFSLIRDNLVLPIPFLVFLLLLGFVLAPLTSASSMLAFAYMLFVAVALFAVFLSGWLNMFKTCVHNASNNEKLSKEEIAINSFSLFKEFLPGVGKYFTKIALGLLFYILLYNFLMLILETIFAYFFGTFAFDKNTLVNNINNPSAAQDFWANISDSDKSKIMKLTVVEGIITFLYCYLTMFWVQFVLIKDLYPLRAFVKSAQKVIMNPFGALFVFLSGFMGIFSVLFFSAILSKDSPFQLLVLFLLVYAIVFYIMLTFLYLEKSEEHKKSNCPGRTDSVRQD